MLILGILVEMLMDAQMGGSPPASLAVSVRAKW